MKIRNFITLSLLFSTILTFAQTAKNPSDLVQNVKSFGCEKHIELNWDEVVNPELGGYRIYYKVGDTYEYLVSVNKDNNFYNDFINALDSSRTYKIATYDIYGSESDLSDSVVGRTKSMTDDEFLDMVERSTFRYFYNYGHPTSGLARERTGSGNTVTTGGSGFGLMALLVGVERGFITRAQGIERMTKILSFLKNNTQKFHGAFPHWFDGASGNIIPFSTYDNGGDLVETAFMAQGFLTVRQYFNGNTPEEANIRTLATSLWEGIEWSWYRRTPTSNFLYWHWSPNYGWQMNMQLAGWNETMITYLLAVASPTYGVPASLYRNGFESSSSYYNGTQYYGHKLYLGSPYGGPLFFAHYSFLGFDPRDKRDYFCNYFLQNKNHTLINRDYCIDNPYGKLGYGENNWGLTASDEPNGYSAHAPFSNDNGTITPTAALSSMPYTPNESIAVLKNFYRTYGSKLYGPYGFKDAFNPGQNWFASSYLAIDQGPIVVMIENYRSKLLWNKFMANPEIAPMLSAIGFYPDSSVAVTEKPELPSELDIIRNFPNPFNPTTKIEFTLQSGVDVKLEVYDIMGTKVSTLLNSFVEKGKHQIVWNGKNDSGNPLPSGVYLSKLSFNGKSITNKMILQK